MSRLISKNTNSSLSSRDLVLALLVNCVQSIELCYTDISSNQTHTLQNIASYDTPPFIIAVVMPSALLKAKNQLILFSAITFHLPSRKYLWSISSSWSPWRLETNALQIEHSRIFAWGKWQQFLEYSCDHLTFQSFSLHYDTN